MSQYIPVIGLEIHAELATQTKLFCRCKNTSSELNTTPNSAVCPTCIGLPGALPVLNEAAVKATVSLGLSLGSTIPTITKWDRKNYFYPDLPKGYQISQYDEPLCAGGNLTWKDREGTTHSIELTRIHLEEDTGKLTHVGDSSLIDYNRSSIPLLELVTEPVISSANEAKQFGEEYQRHLRELNIAEASMEKGQMRCEANISVIPKEWADDPSKRLSGTKVEVKNLNSFRSLERAILHEIERQSRVLDEGGTLHQETRGWNDTKGETYVMRAKETSDDYRYFPEPDLPSLRIPEEFLELKQSGRGELANILESKGAKPDFVFTVVNDPVRRACFEAWQTAELPDSAYALATQWLAQMPQLQGYAPEEMVEFFSQPLDAALRKEIIAQGKPGQLGALIKERLDTRHVDNLSDIITNVLNDNPSEVSRYKAGEVQLFGFFVGQTRKALHGSGDPAAIADELKKQLS